MTHQLSPKFLRSANLNLNHEVWMSFALSLAKGASSSKLVTDVPIGAVIIYLHTSEDRYTGRSSLLATGSNQKELLQKPTAHAEIIAIERASAILGSWRLSHCVLYTSIEPCLMCVGAIIQSRIPLVVYGAQNKKFGALGSLNNTPKSNHKFTYIQGVKEQESQELMQNFFATKKSLNAKDNQEYQGK
ncbi:MAG: nucleoside deaminase [Proteobacteria bacterium]|nr:nucleoside deaminase [Pseudomonadota bacterium]